MDSSEPLNRHFCRSKAVKYRRFHATTVNALRLLTQPFEKQDIDSYFCKGRLGQLSAEGEAGEGLPTHDTICRPHNPKPPTPTPTPTSSKTEAGYSAVFEGEKTYSSHTWQQIGLNNLRHRPLSPLLIMLVNGWGFFFSPVAAAAREEGDDGSRVGDGRRRMFRDR